MKHFIADPHFGHKNILKFSKRPFHSIDDHDATLIANWNKKVKPDDEVYILGDLTMSKSGEYANALLKQLNGRKYLIKGNHEKYLNDPTFDSSLYEWIKDYHAFNHNGIKFVLFHYPILEWDGFYRDSIHLYGHVHNTRPEYFEKQLDPRAINVGVDYTNFTPLTIKEVVQRVNDRQNK